MCTRVFWNDNPIAKVTSRCMDWEVSDEPELWFYPRGLARSGGSRPDAATWRSTYSSVAQRRLPHVVARGQRRHP